MEPPGSPSEEAEPSPLTPTGSPGSPSAKGSPGSEQKPAQAEVWEDAVSQVLFQCINTFSLPVSLPHPVEMHGHSAKS